MAETAAERYARLKKEVAEHNSRADRAQGRLDAAMRTLRDDFGCDSLDAAREKLKRAQAKLTSLEEQLNAELDSIEDAIGAGE